MDKLRNLLNPGKTQDDEVLYGDSSKAHPNDGVVAGQGSHFPGSTTGTAGTGSDATSTTAVHDGVSGSSQHAGSGLTGGSSSTTTTAGPHTSNIGNELDPRVDSNRDGVSALGTTGGASSTAGPHSSNLANKADPRVDSDLDGSRGLGSNTTSGTSGLTGASATNSGYAGQSQTTAGPHDSNLLNKADPRVDSDRDGSTTVGNTSTSGSGTGNYGRDTAIGGTSAGLGAERSQISDRNTGTSNTTAPHSSSLLNRIDPRVDTTGTSTTDNSLTGTGESHRHHGALAGAGVGATGAAYEAEKHGGHEHHHGHHEQTNVQSSSDRHLGRDAGIGATGAGVGYEAERHHHDQTSGTTMGSSSNTTGPHSSNLLNKLDPRVDSSTATGTGNSNTGGLGPMAPARDFDGSAGGQTGPHPYHTRAGAVLDPHGPSTVSGFGGSSGTEYTDSTSSRGHLGRDAGVAGTGASAGTVAGTNSSTTGTTGPHSSSLLNKLDPRVDNNPARESTNVTGTSGSQSHLGRDAGLAAGAGGVGYEAEKHHHHTTEGSQLGGTSGMTGTTGSSATTGPSGSAGYTGTTGATESSTTGPHSSSLLNRLDPRVNTGNTSSSTTAGTTGANHDHLGRDAGLAAGAGGLGYEAEKHHQHTEGSRLGGTSGTTGTTGSSATTGPSGSAGYTGSTGATDSSTTGPHSSSVLNRLDPRVNTTNTSSSATGTSGASHDHLGRDAGLAAGAGGVGYEAEKHHHHTEGSRLGGTSGTTGTTGSSATTGPSGTAGYVGTTGATDSSTTGPHSSGLLNRLDPRVKTSETAASATGGTTGSSHLGRDTGLAGTTGAGTSEAERYHESITGGGLSGNHGASQNTSTGVGSGLGHGSGANTSTTTGHRHGERDTALAGAAGVGTYEAEKHHHSDHHTGQHTGSGITGTHSATGGSALGGDRTGTTSSSGVGESYLTGPVHNSSLLNKLDPRVKKVSPETEAGSEIPHNTTEHHHSRDAALGAGAVGAGYEAEKHHGTSSTTTAGPHSSNLANKADPRVDSDLDGSRTTGDIAGPSGTRYGEHQHGHTVRDGAVGAGAAGVGAHEVSKHEHEHHKHDGDRNRLHKDPPASVTREFEQSLSGGSTGDASAQQPGTSSHLGRNA